MVFESLQKYNGRTEVPLSLTQIKQIAGRAGRYGMHLPKQLTPSNETEIQADTLDGAPGVARPGFYDQQARRTFRQLERQARRIGRDIEDESSTPDEVAQLGGIVTTLHKTDLPVLRDLLPLPLPPITRARIDIPYTIMSDLSILLPPGTPFAQLLDHLNALALLPPNTVANAFDHKVPLADLLEPLRDRLSLAEMDLFSYSPVSTRDPVALNVFTHTVRAYADQGFVDLKTIFRDSRLLVNLDLTEATLATLPPLPPIAGIGRRPLTPPIIIASIPQLETLHKSLVLYIWLSFRLEISFPDRELATKVKLRTEVVLDQCLERLPGVRQKKTTERDKYTDGVVAEWRREYVSPNGTNKVLGRTGKKGIDWSTEAIQMRLKSKAVWQSAQLIEKDENESEGRWGLKGKTSLPLESGSRGDERLTAEYNQ